MIYRLFIMLVALVFGLLGFGLMSGPVQTSFEVELRSQVESCAVSRVIRQTPLVNRLPAAVVMCQRPVVSQKPLGLSEPLPSYSPRSPPPA